MAESETVIESEAVIKSETVIESEAVIKSETVIESEAVIKSETVIESEAVVKSETTCPGYHSSSTLSKAASVAVNQALNSILVKKCTSGGDVAETASALPPSSSTQVLVPIHPFPEESLAVIPASPSFVTKHTHPVESIFEDGIRVHRNQAEIDIDHPSETGLKELQSSVGEGETRTTGGGGGARGEAPQAGVAPFSVTFLGEDATLADQMAAAVASSAGDNSTLALLQDLYGKFSEITKTFAGEINNDGNQQRNPRSNNTEIRRPYQPQAAGPSGGGGHAKLPPEVKERVLRTLSDIKVQLDAVKVQLMKQSGRA